MSDELRARFSIYNKRGVELIANELQVPLEDEAGDALRRDQLIEEIIRQKPIELDGYFKGVDPNEVDPAILAAEIGRTATHEGRHIQGGYKLAAVIVAALLASIGIGRAIQSDGGLEKAETTKDDSEVPKKPTQRVALTVIPIDGPPRHTDYDKFVGRIGNHLGSTEDLSEDLTDDGYVRFDCNLVELLYGSAGNAIGCIVEPRENSPAKDRARCFFDLTDDVTRISVSELQLDKKHSSPESVAGISVTVLGVVSDITPDSLTAGFSIQPARLTLE